MEHFLFDCNDISVQRSWRWDALVFEIGDVDCGRTLTLHSVECLRDILTAWINDAKDNYVAEKAASGYHPCGVCAIYRDLCEGCR